MNDSAYHAARARAEIEAAYRSSSIKAAMVHLQLCRLHLDRARAAPSRSTLGSSWEITWLERAAAFHHGSIGVERGGAALIAPARLSATIVPGQSEGPLLRQL